MLHSKLAILGGLALVAAAAALGGAAADQVCCETSAGFGHPCVRWAERGHCGDAEQGCHTSCLDDWNSCANQCGISPPCFDDCTSTKKRCDGACGDGFAASVVPAPSPEEEEEDTDGQEHECRTACVRAQRGCLDSCGVDQDCISECGETQADCAADCEAASKPPPPPQEPECCRWTRGGFGGPFCVEHGDPYCGTPPDPACKAVCDRTTAACHAACDPDNGNCDDASVPCLRKCGYERNNLKQALRPGRHASAQDQACVQKFWPNW